MTDVPTSQSQPHGFQALAGEPDPFGEHPRNPRRGSYHAELPLTRFSSESELAERVLARLDPWFVIEREVSGQHCCGRSLRIDAIIRPREPHRWRNQRVAFGLEFKLPPTTDINGYTRWIAQAADYTHVDWQGHGRLIVLTCPGAATWLDASSQDDRRDVLIAKRLIGQLGIGELVLRWAYGLTLLVNGEHVWSERHGVSKGRTWNLIPKTGSR
jgi:hypothetical protein